MSLQDFIERLTLLSDFLLESVVDLFNFMKSNFICLFLLALILLRFIVCFLKKVKNRLI